MQETPSVIIIGAGETTMHDIARSNVSEKRQLTLFRSQCYRYGVQAQTRAILRQLDTL